MQPTPPPNQDEGFLKQLQASLGASLEGVLTKFKNLNVENKNLEDSIRKGNASLAGQFGRTQSSVQGLRLSLVESLPVIASMGGKFEDAFELIKLSSEQLGTNRILLGETTKDLFAAKKALGLSEFEFSQAIGSFHDAGIEVGLMRDRMQETLNIARLVGTNSNAVFKNVQVNLSKLNEYGFKDGVEGLSRMAAKAISMRFDMSQIFNFAEKVFSPEGAIEAVATFQRLGVAVGDLADPFRLMYLASEDVEGLTDQVVKMTSKFSYFDEKSKEFKIFPSAKRDLRDLATAMGISYNEMVKMSFAQNKLNQLSSQFKFNANVEETDKQLIANLAQYSKEKGDFVVKVNREEKLVTQLNKEDIKKLRGNPETVEDVARAQLSEVELIEASVNGIFDLLRGISVGSKPSQDLAQLVRASTEAANKAAFKASGGVRGGIRKIDEGYAQIPGVIKELTDDLKNGRLDFQKYTKNILGITEKYAGDLEELAKKIMNFDFKTLMKESALIEKDNLFANALGLGVTATNKLVTWLQTNVYKPVVNTIPNQASSQSTSSGNQTNPSSQAYASTNVDTGPTNFTMTSVNTNLSELGNQVDNTKNKFTDLTTNTSLASVAMTSTNINLSNLGNEVDNTKNKFTDLKSVIEKIIEANNTTPTNVPATSVNTNLRDLATAMGIPYNEMVKMSFVQNKFFDLIENINKQQLGDTPNTIPTNDAMTSVTTNLSNLGNQVDNTKNKFTDLKSIIENIIEANNTTLTSFAMTSDINVLPEIAQLTSIISQFRDINLLTAEKNEIKPLINNDKKIEVATIEPPSSKQLPIQQQNPTMSFSPLNGKIDVRVTREDGGPSVDLTSQVVASTVFQREVLKLIDEKIQQPNYSNVPNSAIPG